MTITLSKSEKEKIRSEASVRYNSSSELQSRYPTLNVYLSIIVDHFLEYQASETLQGEFGSFSNFQAYQEGVALGRIKPRTKK